MKASKVFALNAAVRKFAITKNIHLVILLALCFGYCMAPTEVYAAIIAANSCSRDAVQAAVNSASRGDTITVPAGSCIWTNRVSITKAIIIQGAGVGKTIIKSDISNYPYSDNQLIYYEPSSISEDSNVLFRLTGFTFNLASKSGGVRIRNNGKMPLNKARIDNNAFLNCSYNTPRFSNDAPIFTVGTVYGVVDTNSFEGNIKLMHLGYDTTGTPGRDAWNNLTFNYGTEQNIYYEDNTFTQTTLDYDQYFTSSAGGRYAVRYNEITQNVNNWKNGFDAHPNGSGYFGNFGVEAYGNKFIMPNNNSFRLFDCRGGMCLGFYNRVASSGGVEIAFREESIDNISTPGQATLTNHICPQGSFYLYPGTYSCASNGQPQHVSSSYFWNNRKGTSASGALPSYSIDKNGYINGLPLVENKHYWKDNDSCTASACSSGVGCGSSAPSGTCTTGTAYWKTSQSCF